MSSAAALLPSLNACWSNKKTPAHLHSWAPALGVSGGAEFPSWRFVGGSCRGSEADMSVAAVCVCTCVCAPTQVCVVTVPLGFSVSTRSSWNSCPHHVEHPHTHTFCSSLCFLGTNLGPMHVLGSVWSFAFPRGNCLLVSWTDSLFTLTFVPSLCLREVGEEAGRGPRCDSEDSRPPITDGWVSLEQRVVWHQKILSTLSHRNTLEKRPEPLRKAAYF